MISQSIRFGSARHPKIGIMKYFTVTLILTTYISAIVKALKMSHLNYDHQIHSTDSCANAMCLSSNEKDDEDNNEEEEREKTVNSIR